MSIAAKLLFGEIALKKGLVSQEQIDECLEIQRKLKDMGITRTLGAVMHDKKYLSLVDIKAVLREMGTKEGGNAIEGYEILGKLGKGGMGAVYKARHQKLNKIVALKVLPPELAADQEYLDRFLREARAAAKLNHPNIVQALDVGESYGYHYFVMEYAEGKTVKDMIETRKTLDEASALDIVEQIASALGHAAKHDLVHRDVKPSNIIVSNDGVAKLLDLGLAKSISEDQTITQTGVIMGTPFYLSPEQARSEPLDTRSDFYSLGVTLFHMLAGDVPFSGNSAATILYKHIFQDPPLARSINPKVSAETSALVARMMAKSRDDRPSTADALIAEIEAVRAKTGLPRKTAVRPSGERGPASSGDAPTPGSGIAPAPPSPEEVRDATPLESTSSSLAASGPTTAAPAPDAAGGAPPSSALEETMPEGVAASEVTPEVASLLRRAHLEARPITPPPRGRARSLLALGAVASTATVVLMIAQAVLAPRPLEPNVHADPRDAILAEEQVTPAVADALKHVETLRARNQLPEAVRSFLEVWKTVPGAGTATADELEVDRERAVLLASVKGEFTRLNKAYDEAVRAGRDTQALSADMGALKLPVLASLLEDERLRIERELTK